VKYITNWFCLCFVVEIGWLGQGNGDLKHSTGEQHVTRVDDKLDLK